MQIDRVILSARNLEAQHQFYGEVLGLPVRAESGRIHVQVGRTELILQSDPTVAPFYHLAFRVAAQSPEAAIAWLRSRVPLLRDGAEEIFHSGVSGIRPSSTLPMGTATSWSS